MRIDIRDAAGTRGDGGDAGSNNPPGGADSGASAGGEAEAEAEAAAAAARATAAEAAAGAGDLHAHITNRSFNKVER